MTLQTGEILNNRYRIVKKLGEGGYGAIYRAWDVNFEMPCAVKENFETSPEARRQFMREARILHTLRHPNLPLVKDYFIVPEQGQYLVMDFIEGQDLFEMLEREGGPLPEGKVKGWLSQICEALTYMHHHEPPVIHRDIKPANIKITPQGDVSLVDFGISKLYEPGTPTTLGARAVTPGYSPFEQYGHAPTDVRTDIYSLGATAYTLLTGQVPTESIARMAGTELKPPREFNPEISPQMEVTILRAMETMPADRFSSVGAFRVALMESAPEDQVISKEIAKTKVIDLEEKGVPAEEMIAVEADVKTPSVSITDREQREAALEAEVSVTKPEPVIVDEISPRTGRRGWIWAFGVIVLVGIVVISVIAVTNPFGPPQEAPSQPEEVVPPPDDEAPPPGGEPPPVVLFQVGGPWRGEYREFAEDEVVMELIVEFNQEPGQEVFNGVVFQILPDGRTEEFPFEGRIEGDQIFFVDEPGRHFRGVIVGECIEGEVLWECFECVVFAGFHVCR